MSEPAAQEAYPYSPEQHAALAQLADALGRFGVALDACGQVGIGLVEGLEACGIPIPSWAGPMVDRLLPALAPTDDSAPGA